VRTRDEGTPGIKPSVRKELDTCKQIAAERVLLPKVPVKTPNIKR